MVPKLVKYQLVKVIAGLLPIFTGRNEVLAKVIFSQACVVCPRGGGGGKYLTRHPPGPDTPLYQAGTPPVPGRYTPWAGTPPWVGTPPGQVHPPRQVHPLAGTPLSGQVHPPWTGTPPLWTGTPPLWTGTPPFGQVHPPLDRYTPRAGTPPRQVHPQAGTHPPRQVHPPGRYTPWAPPPGNSRLRNTVHVRPVRILLIGGSRGGVRDARPPLGVQILSISCSFRENLACSRPPWRVHAPPPLGKILDPPLLLECILVPFYACKRIVTYEHCRDSSDSTPSIRLVMLNLIGGNFICCLEKKSFNVTPKLY